MSGKKPETPAPGEKPGEDCHESCVIGLDDCAECGICEHFPDGARLDEDALPSNWQKFIENSIKKS